MCAGADAGTLTWRWGSLPWRGIWARPFGEHTFSGGKGSRNEREFQECPGLWFSLSLIVSNMGFATKTRPCCKTHAANDEEQRKKKQSCALPESFPFLDFFFRSWICRMKKVCGMVQRQALPQKRCGYTEPPPYWYEVEAHSMAIRNGDNAR